MDIKSKIVELKIPERIIGKKFIIYPFGCIGKKVKEILNEEYNMYEFAIVDLACNDKVKNINFFDDYPCDDIMVIIASDNIYYYDEIRNNVRKRFKFENVIDLFGVVNIDIDPRIESLRLSAEIINKNNVKGAVAEAGVFEGDFAKYINLFFKDRTLYLFDTFEGFESDTLKKYIDECWEKWMENNYSFVSSGIEAVKQKMEYPENCIFRKGFFPESAQGINETFCFVNIDMDIYQSTKDGLEFFWPRMEKRGVVFVHDYQSWNCPGVKKAVDEFCDKYEVGIICLPEYNGTAVLIK